MQQPYSWAGLFRRESIWGVLCLKPSDGAEDFTLKAEYFRIVIG